MGKRELRSQVDQFQEQGFLVIENMFDADHIRALRERIESIAAGRVPEYPRSDIEYEPSTTDDSLPMVRKINRCADNDRLFLEHAANQQVLDVVESLIGPDIKLYSSQCFMKPAGGVEKPYHQDSAYFSIQPMELVTCWTAIDDVTRDNGCLNVIPGSHRDGLVDHQVWRLGQREDKQVPLSSLASDREVAITMPAGSCSFHHSLLLHRSGPNRTDHPRRGLAVHYMSARSRWMDRQQPQPTYALLRGDTHPGCV